MPAVPDVGTLAPGSRDAASVPDPGASDPPPWDPTGDSASGVPARGNPTGGARGDAAAGEATGDARADGGVSDRPAITDGRAEGALEVRGDASGTPEVPGARTPRPGEIVIDELLVDPAGNDLGHEWIEIANVAREALDLAALRVSDGTSEVAVDAGVLAAGGLLVLGQSIDRAHNGDAPVDLAYGTKLSLNNGADRIAICVGPCADGVALDAVAWTTPWGDAYVGHAVVVERGGATCPAPEMYGADGNFGSPGAVNPPCPTVAAPDAGGDAVTPPDVGAER